MNQLIGQAVGGCPKAQEELAQKLLPDAKRFARYKTGKRLQQYFSFEDIYQEAFGLVFKAIPELPSEVTLKFIRGRLFLSIESIVAKSARKVDKLSVGFAHNRSIELGNISKEEMTETGSVTRSDQVEYLHNLLNNLTPKYREVVSRKLSGASFGEIGLQMGISKEAARKRFERVVKKLTNLSRRETR